MHLSRPLRRSFLSACLGIASLGVATLNLAGPGFAADPVAIDHARGRLEVMAAPKRVVVFDMPSLDTLDMLGVPVIGVPTGVMPDRLSAYAGEDYEKVGTLFEPDYEAVHHLDPDLVVIGGRSAPKYDELTRLAPTIDMTIDQRAFTESAIARGLALSRLFGKGAEGEAVVTDLRAKIAALRAVTKDAGTGLLILTTGGKLSAYGPGSRFGILHDAFGVTPAVPDLEVSNHGQAISFEYILQADPDWLFVIDRDAAIGRSGTPAKAFLDNEIMHATKAWKAGHVVYLNSADWYLMGGSLRTLDHMTRDLLSAFTGRG